MAYKILCVDDDADDLYLLRKALKQVGSDYEMIEAGDGLAALDALRQMSEGDNLPCLIVLDINMPKMDGRQTFMAIENDPKLSKVPVVIFSTSSSPLDKLFFSKKNVEYITKPIYYETLLTVAQRMLSFCHK